MFKHKSFAAFFLALLSTVTISATTASCSSVSRIFPTETEQQSEAQALENLRQLTRNGNLPSESLVAGIEARYPNTKTAALARLLRAHILLTNGDALNAAGLLLDTNLIAQKSSLGDYALWLRGQAYTKAGKTSDAAATFEKLIKDYPTSLRVRDAKLNIAQIRAQTGETERATSILQDLLEKNDAAAWLVVAQTNERAGKTAEAQAAYRKVYYFAPTAEQAAEAENSLKRLAFDFNTATRDEIVARAEAFFRANKFNEAANAYQFAANTSTLTVQQQLNRGIALVNAKRTPEAASVLNAIPTSAGDIKTTALSKLAEGYAKARLWTQARSTIEELRRTFPNSPTTPAAYANLGAIARDQKNKPEESFYLRTAVTTYPNAVDVGRAQFELAWLEHESGNVSVSSQQLIEHLARYADKDTTYRGRAGYWAARDSERAGRIAEACYLYEAMQARYDANWYGYIAKQRLDSLRANRRCPAGNNAPSQLVGQAAANLKTVTVAPETSTQREAERIAKAEDLASVALFDWSLYELQEAQKTAANSPKINLSLARLYRYKGDNVSAFLALAKSYPDYSQMKPEEMTREEWEVFYPLNYWEDIKFWARTRNLDPYQVAGLIRQESVFNPRAKSSANAFGLMQLIIPTARTMARKSGAGGINSGEDLYQPKLNIELGTAYMREQLDKYGRVEYLAVAYNAGPGRVVQWRNSLPLEMDEFVEAIPFRETKAYVQGVVRNTAQYRRLYEENGQFKSNVGSRPLRGEIDSKSREQLAQEFPDVKILEKDAAE